MGLDEDRNHVLNQVTKLDSCIYKNKNCFCKIKNREIKVVEDILKTCENCKCFVAKDVLLEEKE